MMTGRWIDICLLLAALTLPAGCAGGGSGGDGNPLAALGLASPSPRETAAGMFNRYDADQRRRSINRIADAEWGGEPPYLRAYRLLLDDSDPTVRTAALRALARHGQPEDVRRIAPLLEDEADLVRWEAATALQRLHHPAAIDPLVSALREDPEENVRRAAASALAQYPRPRVFQALVGVLDDNSYSVVREAVRSLRTLTGQRFGEDGGDWLAWARETENLFADQRPYYYPRYTEPPGFVDRMIFWDRPEQPERRRPRGVGSAIADPRSQ